MLGVTRIGITLSASDLKKKQGVIACPVDLRVNGTAWKRRFVCYSADREIYRSPRRND
jgi:hypothetical protein